MKRAFLIPCVVMIGSISSVQARAPGSQPASGENDPASYDRSVVLRVACDPALLPSGSYLPIKYLLDAGIVQKAASGVLLRGYTVTGVGGVQIPAVIADARLDEGPDTNPFGAAAGAAAANVGARNVIVISTSLNAADTVSSKQWSAIAEAIRQDLQEALLRLHEVEVHRLDALVKRASVQAESLDEQLRQLRRARADLVSAADSGDLSRESVMELAREVQKERQEVSLRAEYVAARQDAIQKMIAEAAAAAKDSARLDNPIIEAYRAKLAAVEANLGEIRMRHESGLVSKAELRQAEVELAAAKGELASKVQEVVNTAGGSRLPMLNDELSKITLELIDAQTRREVLAKRAAEIRELIGLADKYESEVGAKLPAVERAYQAASERLLQLELQRSSIQPPEVMLLSR